MERPLLFCLLVHGFPRQTLRLLRTIYSHRHHYVLHVDRSAKPEYRALLEAVAARFPNVNVISNHVCAWGGFSLVRAELDMLTAALEAARPWTHAILLSGTHLPMWPLDRIATWLADGTSCISWYEFPHKEQRPEGVWAGNVFDRFTWSYREEPGVGMRRIERIAAPDFVYAVGPQWVVLARDHAHYAVGPAAAPIRDRLSITDVADSAYFQTVLCNSPHRHRCDRRKSSTTVVWADDRAHPKSFGLAEYVAVAANSSTPFLRKIDEDLGDEAGADQAIAQFAGEPEVPDFRERVLA